MRGTWTITLLLLLTLAPAAGIIILAFDDPEGAARREEERERAAATVVARSAAQSVAASIAENARAAADRLDSAALRLERGELPPPGSALLLDAGGSEVAPLRAIAVRSLPSRELDAFRDLAARADQLEFASGHMRTGAFLAREACEGRLDHFRDPGLRGEVLLRIARASRKLGEEETARKIERRVFETGRGAISPATGFPIDLMAAAALRSSTGGDPPDEGIIAEARRRLARLSDGLDAASFESLRRWLEGAAVGADGPEAGDAPARELISNKKKLLAALDAVLPEDFAGDPLLLAGADGRPAVALFRKVLGTSLFLATAVPLGAEMLPSPHPAYQIAWRPAPDADGVRVPAAFPLEIEVPGAAGVKVVRCGAIVVETGAIAAIRDAGRSARDRRRAALGFLGLMLIGCGVGLVSAVRRESEVVRLRTQLVEHVAHELRTPAAALGVFSNLLDDARLPADRRDRYLRMLAAEAQRIGFVVENVIDLSLPGRNLHLEREEVDVAKLLGDLSAAFRPRCEEDGIDLAAAVGPLPAVRTYRRGVARIVFNLLDNAVKHRGGSVRPRVRLEGRLAEGRVEISVLDDGPGIPPEARRRLFRKRFPADPGGAGSGVGLLISARLARLLGGELRYEALGEAGSGRGASAGEAWPRGSRFTLVLPMEEAA